MKGNFSYGARKSRPQPKQEVDLHLAAAQLARSIAFTGLPAGGLCALRALTGSVILERFGIENKIVTGGCLYRAGLGDHDCILFAGLDNKGHWPQYYHCWLESGEDLIDFSSGDWRDVLDGTRDVGLPPINWMFPPPRYIWQKREPLVSAWMPAPIGPAPGCVWYGPMTEQNMSAFHENMEAERAWMSDVVDKVFMKLGLPVCKIFPSGKDRDDYLKENGLALPDESQKDPDVLITFPSRKAGA